MMWLTSKENGEVKVVDYPVYFRNASKRLYQREGNIL
jgi:hypothetical protein